MPSPKWTNLPSEPVFYQPIQVKFLEARRQRRCPACKTEYLATDSVTCPTCQQKGIRIWDRLLIIAGRRFGKTLIGSIAAAEEATIPNSTVWCCAPTNPKLHRYVIPAMQQLIPASWVKSWSSEYLDLRLKNGSLIHFQTLEHPDQGRGQGLDCLWIDEVCELSPPRGLKSCNRIVFIAVLIALAGAPAALAAGDPHNSEQVIFSGKGTGTFDDVSTPVGFWIWCEDESNNKYAGRCNGAMYFYALGITRSVKGTIEENAADEYVMSVFSSRDDSIDCVLQNTNPVMHGPNNRVSITCTTPLGTGLSTNAVVNVTGPPED